MLLLQLCDVFIHLLLMQRIPDAQHQRQQEEAQRGHERGDGEDAALHLGRLPGCGAGDVADGRQQPAGQPGGGCLPQLACKGVQRVDGAVLAHAVLRR